MNKLILIPALLFSLNLCAETKSGTIIESEYSIGQANLDYLIETGKENHSVAIGYSNLTMVWGWCDNQSSKEKAASCARKACPALNCKTFSINKEAINKELIVPYSALGWDMEFLREQYESDIYEKTKRELYEKNSTDLTEGFAGAIVRGLLLAALFMLLFKVFRREEKINENIDDD